MCNPALAVAAITVASSAYSIHESNTQQNYAEAVAKQNAEMQNAAAEENYKLQNRQLNMQQLQESEATALEKHKQRLAVQREVATARVAAGESGVSGLSIDSLFADIIRQGANNMTTLDRNLADANDQRDIEKKALQNNTWAGLQNPSFYKGSNGMLGAGLQIASSGLSAYSAAGGTFGSGTKTPSYQKQLSSARAAGTGTYGGMRQGR
jgi:hypothetical protein